MIDKISKMNTEKVIEFLTSFFKIFDAYIYEYKVLENKIEGTLKWINEDEYQGFSYQIENISSISKMKLLCEYLVNNDLMRGDKITITEKELLKKLTIDLKWNFSDVEKVINGLCETEIKMIDEGKETDSFFVHF